MSTPSSGNSGKLLILAVLGVGMAAAGASWWFRYATTHQSAEFWGPEAARLIRDAPHVTLVASPQSAELDISTAPGLTHLRAALLEDRSFDWPVPESPPAVEWTTQLQFRDGPDAGAASVAIFFSTDFHWAFAGNEHNSTNQAISCRPIAAGLQQFVDEQASDPTTER